MAQAQAQVIVMAQVMAQVMVQVIAMVGETMKLETKILIATAILFAFIVGHYAGYNTGRFEVMKTMGMGIYAPPVGPEEK